jgi:hypothetical protein
MRTARTADVLEQGRVVHVALLLRHPGTFGQRDRRPTRPHRLLRLASDAEVGDQGKPGEDIGEAERCHRRKVHRTRNTI